MKRTRILATATIAVFAMTATIALKANDDKSSDAQQFKFQPNSLVLSRSVYTGDANTVAAGQILPPWAGRQLWCYVSDLPGQY